MRPTIFSNHRGDRRSDSRSVSSDGRSSDAAKAKEIGIPHGLTRIYSNNVSIGATRFDLKLLFGEIIEATDDKAIVENRVQVTIDSLEAKIPADFLSVNI